MRNRTVIFVITVYVLTALYSLLYLVFPVEKKDFAALAVTAMYMWLPFAASFILQKFIYKEPMKEIFVVFKWSNWYFAAVFIPIAMSFTSFGISLLLPGVSFDPDMSAFLEKIAAYSTPEQMEKAKASLEPLRNFFIPIMLLQGILAGITINALFSFGEEAGWRGFMLSALKGRNFFIASLIIGAVWGFWHAPVILQGHNYPDHRVEGVFMMAAFTILLTPVMIYLVKKSGSVLSAAFFHGVMNATAGVQLMYIKGGNDLTTGLTGLSGLITLAIVNLLLIIYDRFFAKEKVII